MVTNKTLALFIIVTVIVSLGGTLLSLNKLQEISQVKYLPIKQVTGNANAQGQVQLAISSNISCNVDSNVSFGSSGLLGSVITISTMKDNTAISNFSNCQPGISPCAGIQINNTGNVNINVSFYSSANGTTLLGLGTVEGDFNYTVLNGTLAGPATEPGCRGDIGYPGGGGSIWYNVPQGVGNTTRICQNLTYNDSADAITMEFNVSITPTTTIGTKNATIYITCAQN